MKHTIYFLITPKPELVSCLQGASVIGFEDLLQPVMWSGSEFDKSSLRHSDFDLLAKILFIDTLMRERGAQIGFSNVFLNMQISEIDFDKLWILQRVRLDMSIEDALEDAIDTGTIHSIKIEGNDRVGNLLEFYRRKVPHSE